MSPQPVRLFFNDENYVIVDLHGATVTSCVLKGTECLFLSSQGVLDGVTPIRGGIPVVFPVFGPGEGDMPKHGFGRTSRWELVENIPMVFADGQRNPDFKEARLVMQLTDSEETRKIWDFGFVIKLIVTIPQAGVVNVALEVQNTDTKPITFQALLHTYFKTPDIEKVCISGVKGQYADKTQGGEVVDDDSEVITIDKEIDRVYFDTESSTHTLSLAQDRSMQIDKVNLPDTVVWNPWAELSQSLADMSDEGYKSMVCVEAGAVHSPVVVAENETWTGSQTLTVL